MKSAICSLKKILPLRLLGLALLCFPGAILAEDYEILGIDNRDYEFMFFEPAFLRVEPGDRVTFVVHHFDHKPRSIFVPDGAEHWEADQGQSITVTLEQEGVYLFDCFYHNVQGMAGRGRAGQPRRGTSLFRPVPGSNLRHEQGPARSHLGPGTRPARTGRRGKRGREAPGADRSESVNRRHRLFRIQGPQSPSIWQNAR